MPNRPPVHRPFPQRSALPSSTARRQAAPHRRLYDRRAYRDRFCPMILAERPVCEDCQREPAQHVHHKRKLELHPEDLLDPEQVRALCDGCHSVRTRRGE